MPRRGRFPAIVMVALSAVLLFGACRRSTAAPTAALTSARAPTPTSTRRIESARPSGNAEGEAEERAREIAEQLREISPYAPDERGLERLFGDIVASARAGDRARLGALLTPLIADRLHVRLVLTFDGDRELGGYLSGPAVGSADGFVARAMTWGPAVRTDVRSATAADVQAGRPHALDARLSSVSQWLRPLVRFYRVVLTDAQGASLATIETLVNAGGRWLWLPEPWRFAPGSVDRGAVVPSPPWAPALPAGAPR